ncbi:BMC domain-containing protein [uncultured Anaerococcus sp.]|uniref:BMC domain-containing protein n=1 Tax=uncultured Anaerococcus sp. TaxID=293428 RepID=UPI00288AB844|nr:BMC domain-containing protein [uncultured Anaerococcus sp.]
MEHLERIIQESVPGKQISLLHVISSPDISVNDKLGIESGNAIGILTLTPTETAIIAADIAAKASLVDICFIDRFNGSVIIQGDVSAVVNALEEVAREFQMLLGFDVCKVTKT